MSIPRSEVQAEFSRSSGPGGQHVNRTESRVTLRWSLVRSASLPDAEKEWLTRRLASRLTRHGELLVHCERTRDRGRNLAEAFERLEEILRRAMERPKPRKRTRPPAAAGARRRKEKQGRAQVKRSRRRPDVEE